MVRTSCPTQQSGVFSRGSPQSPHKALWGHLVAQVAPLVYLRGSPLHSTTTCAKYFSCQCDSQEERHEVKFGGRKYREQVWSYKWLSLNPPSSQMPLTRSAWLLSSPAGHEQHPSLTEGKEWRHWGSAARSSLTHIWFVVAEIKHKDFPVTTLGTNKKLNLPHV